jgi:hypothetical protein
VATVFGLRVKFQLSLTVPFFKLFVYVIEIYMFYVLLLKAKIQVHNLNFFTVHRHEPICPEKRLTCTVKNEREVEERVNRTTLGPYSCLKIK